MAYISLYRKYRSQNFAEVSGQEHVTRTLGNAIASGRVSHAYLFCGPRGTGKTSVARLLAKCLNCAEAPTLTPCNMCPSCVEINAGITGASFNVQEFDAASKRGIDDIRQLRETIGTGRWGAGEEHKGRKVVIIDEVHMLTTEAFNALLKTLEEPPEHVLFVLATTDVHKVPATIVSRCQRFDFHRGSLEQIAARLRFVADQEGVTVEEAAIERVARGSGGSWRDALSLLEQVLAYGGDRVTVADVTTVLGTVAEEDLARLAGAIAAHDGAAIFAEVDRLISDGRDIRQLTRDLTEFMRQLLLAAVGAAPTSDIAEEQAGLARAFGVPRLVAALELLAGTEREFRESDQLRLILEVVLVRLSHLAGAPGAITAVEAPRENGAVVASREAPRVVPRPPTAASQPSPEADSSPANSVKPAAPRASESGPPAEDSRHVPVAAEPTSVDLATVQKRWGVLVEELRRRRHNTTAELVRDARPMRLDETRVVLAFEFDTHAQIVQRPDHRKRFEEAAAHVFGVPLQVVGGAASPPQAEEAVPTPAPRPARKVGVARPPAPIPDSTELVDNSRLVHEVIEMFDGQMMEDEPE